MEDFKDVLAFHKKFDLPRGTSPALMSEEAFRFRLGFLHEERKEFDVAWQQGNLVKVVDALLDFVYVAIGTALFIGCSRNEWPAQERVAHVSMVNGLIVPGAPRLLPKGQQLAFSYALENRVGFFANAYSSALLLEPGSLNMALHAIRLCCIDAYLAAASMNVPWRECWQHVQNANMSKLRAKWDGATASVRSTEFDVTKPAGWTGPDAKIATELQIAGWIVPDMLLVDNLTGRVEMMNDNGSYAGLNRRK